MLKVHSRFSPNGSDRRQTKADKDKYKVLPSDSPLEILELIRLSCHETYFLLYDALHRSMP